jgi:hypothetical protein
LGWGTGLCVFSFELAPSILKQQNHFSKKTKQIRVCYVFKAYSLDDTITRNLLTVNMRQIMKTQEVINSPIMRETFIPKGLVAEKK